MLTNAVPGGAFRGFGAPQGAFVAETQMNKLAERLGIDPVELRLRNVLRDGSIGPTGTEMPPGREPAGGDRPLRGRGQLGGSRHPRWQPSRPSPRCLPTPGALRRGRGFACGYKNVGFSFGFPERCEARIVLHGGEDGLDAVERVELFHAGAEVGQGAHTAFTADGGRGRRRAGRAGRGRLLRHRPDR